MEEMFFLINLDSDSLDEATKEMNNLCLVENDRNSSYLDDD